MNKGKRTALVTGGCGFIGSNLVKRLVTDGWKVDVVDDFSNGHLELLASCNIRSVPANMMHIYEAHHEHERSESTVLVVNGDFVDDAIMHRVRNYGYDVIFHVAALPRVSQSMEQPTYTTEANLLKTVGLFEVAARYNTRVVFSSSSAVYGDIDQLPTPESCQQHPESPYGLQKLTAEKFAGLLAKNMHLDVICLRYFNVYGPGQYGDSPYSTVIAAWFDKVFAETQLRFDGDGTQSRDMVYVGDVVEANILAAEKQVQFSGECVNIGSGKSLTNLEILETFKKQWSVVVQNAPKRPGDVQATLADTSYAQSLLGFEAKVTFEQGFELTRSWWEQSSR